METMQNMTSCDYMPAVKSTRTVDQELFNRFYAYIDSTPKTLETYQKALRQMIRFFIFKGITQPKRADIIAYKEYLTAAAKKPTTIQNYITAARLFFTWTAQEGLYPNIAEHIKGAKLDREHKKDYLTSQQVKDLLEHIDTSSTQGKRDYAIILLMVTGGLRDIEISRANIEDLRAAGDNTVLYVQGKGREEKTDYIKISAPVEKALRSYLSIRDNAEEEQPLFTSFSNNSTGKRLSTRSISGLVKNRLQKAGYNSERLTAHSMRHTAVTLALLSGQDITQVQQFARHANINTTMIYNHAIDKAKNSCSQSITDLIL